MQVHIVLLHGHALDAAVWEQGFKAALAPHRVVAIDLLGHGAKEDADLSGGFDVLVRRRAP